jgi:hypothetical protein
MLRHEAVDVTDFGEEQFRLKRIARENDGPMLISIRFEDLSYHNHAPGQTTRLPRLLRPEKAFEGRHVSTRKGSQLWGLAVQRKGFCGLLLAKTMVTQCVIIVGIFMTRVSRANGNGRLGYFDRIVALFDSPETLPCISLIQKDPVSVVVLKPDFEHLVFE